MLNSKLHSEDRVFSKSSRLIVRLPNWVGDVVMALPVLQALHDVGFQLELYGRKWALDLLQSFPAQVYPIPPTFFQARKEIAKNAANQALLLTNSLSSAGIMRLANKKIIGYKTDGRSCLLTQGLSKPTHIHEVEFFWKLGELATQIWMPDADWPDSIPNKILLPINPISVNKVNQLLEAVQIKAPFVVLNPMATGNNKQNQPKIWPHWQALANHLSKAGIVYLAAPGPGEEERTRQLLPQAKILNGLNLHELAALLKQAQFVISNDSGPMHLAAACQTPVLGIFGVTDPQRTSPWGGSFIGGLRRWPSLEEVVGVLPLEF
jgi:heptosyltransferase II